MPNLTKGQMEDEISKAIIKFQKEHMGRGPKEAKTYIIEDMILVRLKETLTPAEQTLGNSPKGAGLIKEVKMQLMESSRLLLEDIICNLTGCKVTSIHTDISTRTGERVILFILDKRLEEILPQGGTSSKKS